MLGRFSPSTKCTFAILNPFGAGMPAKRILLMEDEPDSAELLALGLRSAGYTVDVAARLAR